VSTLFAVAVLCTVSRFVIRLLSRRRPALDDWLVLLANAALAVAWAVLLHYLDALYIVEALNDDDGAVNLTLADIDPLLHIPEWNSIFGEFCCGVWSSMFLQAGEEGYIDECTAG
jgi:hypothetical protein